METMNYVVAVSGGVDSMVLLDMLTRRSEQFPISNFQFPNDAQKSIINNTKSQLIVAHFDHGIREDSASDEAFVRGVAGKYDLPYETERVELGADTSEEKARIARYNFLRRCCNKHTATLITAHHQDDLVETMLINLIRGTGWRGLVPMSQILSNDQPILRPLLNVPKTELLEYAKKHNLKWREDSTNTDTAYLRNYIRLKLLPQMLQKDPKAKQKLVDIYTQTTELKIEIATQLQNFLINYQISTIKYNVPRYVLIMLPSPVAKEVIYQILTQLDPVWHPTEKQFIRVFHFARTALPGKRLTVSKYLHISSKAGDIMFQNRV